MLCTLIDLKSILLFATLSSDSNRSVVTILESQSKPNEILFDSLKSVMDTKLYTRLYKDKTEYYIVKLKISHTCCWSFTAIDRITMFSNAVTNHLTVKSIRWGKTLNFTVTPYITLFTCYKKIKEH